jgi:hypothetical protein
MNSTYSHFLGVRKEQRTSNPKRSSLILYSRTDLRQYWTLYHLVQHHQWVQSERVVAKISFLHSCMQIFMECEKQSTTSMLIMREPMLEALSLSLPRLVRHFVRERQVRVRVCSLSHLSYSFARYDNSGAYTSARVASWWHVLIQKLFFNHTPRKLRARRVHFHKLFCRDATID